MRYLLSRLRDDLPSLALATLMLLVAVWSLIGADWVEGLGILLPVIGVGLVTGYLLAISRFSDLFVLVTTAFYGWFTVWVLAGRLIAAPLRLGERLLEINFRLAVWVESAVEGGFSRDNLVFLVLVGLLAWIVTFNMAWGLFRRRRLWQAVVPAGLGLAINAYYYFGPMPIDLMVGAYVFLTLTLAVRTNIVNREQVWRREGAGYKPGLHFDLFRGGLAAVVVLLMLAWFAPTASASDRLAQLWERSDNPWIRAQETFQRLFSAVEGSTTITPTYYGGTTLSMGGPVNLSDVPVMTVYAPQGFRYYWRSKVFDAYVDGRWWARVDARANSDFGLLRAEEETVYTLRQNVQQRFELSIPATRLLYAAPQPLSFSSLPVTYELILTSPGSDYGTVTNVNSRDLLGAGDVYGATSSLSIADEASLRAAGTDYPEWVRERYLGLPDSVTLRTRRLAEELAAGTDNPYDTARAVERYLRQAITYNDNVAPPPEGIEPVDYLLFERQEGYCVYYASAMGVLLRAQGIPARVAAGFAQGALDPAVDGYVVAESDAHTWVEVYFPHYGWVEFEPTASRELIVRAESLSLDGFLPFDPDNMQANPLNPDEALAPTPAPREGPSADGPQVIPGQAGGLSAAARLLRGLTLLALLGGGAAGLWVWLDRRSLRRLSEVGRSYARLNTHAPWVGLDFLPSDTPHERAAALGERVPQGRGPIRRIVDLYAQEIYTAERLTTWRGDAQRQAREAWEATRRVLVRAGLLNRLRRFNPFSGRDFTIR